MAVGRGPKLTMPILARINFFHKNDPNLLCILNSKWSKKIWSAYIWPVGSRAFDQNGPQYGAQNTRVGIFFIKRTPFEFWFCVRNSWNFFKSVHFGPIGRPPNMSNVGLQILMKDCWS